MRILSARSVLPLIIAVLASLACGCQMRLNSHQDLSEFLAIQQPAQTATSATAAIADAANKQVAPAAGNTHLASYSSSISNANSNSSKNANLRNNAAQNRVDKVSFEQPNVEGLANQRALAGDQLAPLALDDAIRMALESTAIVRDRNDFLSPANGLLNNPGAVPSAFDVSLQTTSSQGVEAALAAFDAQLALGVQWGQDALIQSNSFQTGNVGSSDVLATGNGALFARLDKPLARGGVFSLIPNWNYAFNNFPSQSFNSQYAGFMRAEYRQPLLAGSGAAFTNIAGPRNFRRGGMRRGLAVARIDQHVTQLEFETQVQKLLRQTIDSYWDLWLAYQQYYSRASARDSAYELWQRVRGRAAAGLNGGAAADDAEAEESFHERRNMADAAKAEVLEREAQLRRLLGLPPNSMRVFHPIDAPGAAMVRFDARDAFARAMVSRREIHKTNLWVRGLEMQLTAAKSLTLPQLDLVTGLQANGLGDGVFGSGANPLLDPDKLGWNAGLEFSMPFGFRGAKARVRNLELQIAKARAAIAAQQDEIAHELAYAMRKMERWHASLTTAADRLNAAKRRLTAVQADYSAGRTPLDRLVRAQVALANAESAYASSIANYNKSLAEFHFRSGDLLQQHAVFLTQPTDPESPLPMTTGATPEFHSPQRN